MSDYLIKGAVSNAINMPSITAEEAPRLKPFVKLAEVLGAFVGQVTEDPIKEVEILFDGSTAAMNTRALISAALAGLIRPQVADVNMVSAPIMVKERGIIVAEVKRDKSGVFDGYIKLTVKTEQQTRSIAGTCFSDGKPRFIQIKGINLDAEVGQHMLYMTNADAPGIIGLLGTVLRRRTASTSPTSSSAATGRAATPSRCSISTRRSRKRCWTAAGAQVDRLGQAAAVRRRQRLTRYSRKALSKARLRPRLSVFAAARPSK